MSDVVVDESPAVAVADIPEVPRVSGDDVAVESSEFNAITSQEALENVLKGRLERAAKSAEKKYQQQVDELNAKISQYETAQLSAEEKKDKRLSELEQNLAEATDRYTKLERTRLVETLARDMGLPEKFWSRVQGSTDDEIISDINDMLEGLPRADRQNTVTSQAPKLSVQATNTDPEVEESAKGIVDKIGSMFNF
jgi:2-oxoglutarate dehydrogenase complex dehydrogenase (E1) component-like enzyme